MRNGFALGWCKCEFCLLRLFQTCWKRNQADRQFRRERAPHQVDEPRCKQFIVLLGQLVGHVSLFYCERANSCLHAFAIVHSEIVRLEAFSNIPPDTNCEEIESSNPPPALLDNDV